MYDDSEIAFQSLGQRHAGRMPKSNHMSDRRGDACRISQSGHSDHVDTAWKFSADARQSLQRETGLAAAAGTGKSQEAHVRRNQELVDIRYFLLSPDKGS